MDTLEFIALADTGAHFRVDGWGTGIAWYTLGHPMIRDEDYDWTGMEYPDSSSAIMVMVGDDREFIEPIENIEPIPEDSFCRDCGQIGCGHNVYS